MTFGNVWRIAPDKNGRGWADCVEHSCIGIGWGERGDFRLIGDQAELRRRLLRDGGEGQRGAKKIWQFIDEIKIGDLVIANKGESVILGIGRVIGPYIPSTDPTNPMTTSEISQIRKVAWIVKQPLDVGQRFFGHLPPFLGEITETQWTSIVEAYLAAGLDVQRAFQVSTTVNNEIPIALLDPEVSGLEGAISVSMRFHYERDRELRDKKIAAVLASTKRLCCEVLGCGFDFEQRYGELGRGFAHVHHVEQLSDRGGAKETKLSELAIVCANCHAMIHRYGGCRSLATLITR